MKLFKPFSLDLIFRVSKKGDLLGMPNAYIVVKNYSRDSADSPPLITPCCVSERELDFEIDRLHNELEMLRKKAKKKFADAVKRQK